MLAQLKVNFQIFNAIRFFAVISVLFSLIDGPLVISFKENFPLPDYLSTAKIILICKSSI